MLHKHFDNNYVLAQMLLIVLDNTDLVLTQNFSIFGDFSKFYTNYLNRKEYDDQYVTVHIFHLTFRHYRLYANGTTPLIYDKRQER